MNKYTLVVRTGDAEIKALENTSSAVLNNVFPLIEVTRGRRRTENKGTPEEKVSYPIEPRLEKIKKVLQGKVVGVTLTTENLLFCSEIASLYNPDNGYEAWVKFLTDLKEEKCFKEIIPVIIINSEDDYYEYNLIKQLQELKKHFNTIIYRNSIIDKFGYDDLEILKEEINDIKFSIIVDCGYTPQSSHENVGSKVISRVENFGDLLNDVENIEYTVISTSFPNNVNDLGGGDYDEYLISSVLLHEQINKKLENVAYGDYGSINPIRNDGTVMARGWIPRIDVPLKNIVYYYRKRRPTGVTAYAETYEDVAQLAISDRKFPAELEESNWGIQQILDCASGFKPGTTPSFWISVRMNIHIEQQVRRLS